MKSIKILSTLLLVATVLSFTSCDVEQKNAVKVPPQNDNKGIASGKVGDINGCWAVVGDYDYYYIVEEKDGVAVIIEMRNNYDDWEWVSVPYLAGRYLVKSTATLEWYYYDSFSLKYNKEENMFISEGAWFNMARIVWENGSRADVEYIGTCVRIERDKYFNAYYDEMIANARSYEEDFKQDSIAYYAASTGTANGHEYVDLGLPSGLKWATCNVGATAPEKYGNYYAWGETEPKTTYSWSTYKWCDGSYDTQTKYCTSSSYGTVDNKTVLELTDDAARANWGGAWRMPTDDEWTELRENCEWTWTDNYNGTGVAGRIVTSNINGNSIFLPAAGYRSSGDLYYAGSSGYCWSSSLNTDDSNYAWYVSFYSGNVRRLDNYRYYGRSVRPVLFGE